MLIAKENRGSGVNFGFILLPCTPVTQTLVSGLLLQVTDKSLLVDENLRIASNCKDDDQNHKEFIVIST